MASYNDDVRNVTGRSSVHENPWREGEPIKLYGFLITEITPYVYLRRSMNMEGYVRKD
ncbi:hypothetical protein KIN20_033488 [Parelaphostrongylus tenuis]|uniref:Uncharacterized protein n=1 Tax=Parelaphostrongylus tenuis TaxID=148309 RepID=A0AAD5R8P9_PARTN|nr:hypothetical protein KIN20_033488 [Parelaphostrongylus tenuis]